MGGLREMPSGESGKDFKFKTKQEGMEKLASKADMIKGADESMKDVLAENAVSQLDSRLTNLEVSEISAALKKIDQEIKKIGDSDPTKAQDLEDLRGFVGNLISIKQSPSSKNRILDKMAKFQLSDIKRLEGSFNLGDNIRSGLDGLSKASERIAEAHFPEQYKKYADEVQKKLDNDVDFAAKKAKMLAMKVSG
ncbi:MAG: hypothetical protein NTX72_04625 [Candidatus Uhrbacteria bacterium]|nr:hypothetical protein [Candidatus Uhrbacteria bacterium]